MQFLTYFDSLLQADKWPSCARVQGVFNPSPFTASPFTASPLPGVQQLPEGYTVAFEEPGELPAGKIARPLHLPALPEHTRDAEKRITEPTKHCPNQRESRAAVAELAA